MSLQQSTSRPLPLREGNPVAIPRIQSSLAALLTTTLVLASLSGGASAQSGIVGWGTSGFNQINAPALPPGLSYVQVSGGYVHSVAVRSDGAAVAFGENGEGQCSVPALPAGLSYVEASGGY